MEQDPSLRQAGGIHGPDGAITHYRVFRPDQGRPYVVFGSSERPLASAMFADDLARHMAVPYYIERPEGGFLSVETLKASATAEEWSRLMEHALCIACLDGNAFPDLVEQYAPEAYVNLCRNGWPPIAALPNTKESGQ